MTCILEKWFGKIVNKKYNYKYEIDNVLARRELDV